PQNLRRTVTLARTQDQRPVLMRMRNGDHAPCSPLTADLTYVKMRWSPLLVRFARRFALFLYAVLPDSCYWRVGVASITGLRPVLASNFHSAYNLARF